MAIFSENMPKHLVKFLDLVYNKNIMRIGRENIMQISIPTSFMKMEGSYVASVVLTGLAVVFLALFLLIFVFKLFGLIFSRKPKPKKVKKAKAVKQEQEVKQSTPPAAAAKVEETAVTPPESDGISEEIIAVISAAIAAISASSGKKLKLMSVKASGSSRKLWAQAGLNDNTRPF